MRISVATRILVALVAAVTLGVIVSISGSPRLLAAAETVEPIGTAWVRAIQMTVIPLVISLLITGIASGTTRGVASVGGHALLFFAVMASASAVFGALLAPILLSPVPADAAAVQSLAGEMPGVALPPFRDWLLALVPANPVQAAAQGEMLPLIVFTGLFAFGVARIPAARRRPLVEFFEGVAGAVLRIVEWILAVGPIGVFCIALPLTARSGAALAGWMGYFVLVTCLLLVTALAALYPLVFVVARVPIRKFARACADAQAVGFSTRSSLASLPALLAGAERELRLPTTVSGVVLPVAVAVFKFGSPMVRLAGTLFVAQLYGIGLGPVEIGAMAAAIAALSFYSPGIPSGGLLVIAPLYLAFNLPLEGIALLIGLDLVPDMFLTATNVTADRAVAAALAPRQGTHGP
jgi:Na+/H+-dicarboxylate symporter